MKNVFITLLCIFFATSSNAQTIYSNEKDVYSSTNIIFYGFDFTDFQLSDPKRMGQDLKKYIFALTGFLIERLPENKLQKWVSKENIRYNLNPTMQLNKKIDNEDLSAAMKHTIDKDSIQSFINRYQISEKEGIGYVIIYECFDNSAKKVSAYSAFFDISTKKILMLEYAVKHDHNSFNKILDWNAPAFAVIKELTEKYLSKGELTK